MTASAAFSHPDVRALWDRHNAAARVFHVSDAQYGALEGDAWMEYDVRYVVPPFPAFALVVDEPRWEPAIDDAALHARTTRLLVDAGESAWRIAERVEFRRADAPDATSQAVIVGALFNP